VRVYVLQRLESAAIHQVLARALRDPEHGLAGRESLTDEARTRLAQAADGDARWALIWLERVALRSQR
jgi:putative ATPase